MINFSIFLSISIVVIYWRLFFFSSASVFAAISSTFVVSAAGITILSICVTIISGVASPFNSATMRSLMCSNALVFSTHPPVSVYGTVFACAISWKSFATSVIRYNLNNLRPSSLSSWSWNFNHVPIDYGLRPRLRGRLTLRCLPLRRKPWIFGGEAFHLSLCYLCQHSHF